MLANNYTSRVSSSRYNSTISNEPLTISNDDFLNRQLEYYSGQFAENFESYPPFFNSIDTSSYGGKPEISTYANLQVTTNSHGMGSLFSVPFDCTENFGFPNSSTQVSGSYIADNHSMNNESISFNSNDTLPPADQSVQIASSPLTSMIDVFNQSDQNLHFPLTSSFNQEIEYSELDISNYSPQNYHNWESKPAQLSTNYYIFKKPSFTKIQPQSCPLCNKMIRRDLSRHIRTHELESRFKCTFPSESCHHKTKQFNRPYDFKKHLLNYHFKFDDSKVKRFHNLKEKLIHKGQCPCGLRTTAKIWLNDHILSEDDSKSCPMVCPHSK